MQTCLQPCATEQAASFMLTRLKYLQNGLAGVHCSCQLTCSMTGTAEALFLPPCCAVHAHPQGREKEVIVFSTVRSNARGSLGFVSDPRRLNVALTRARRGLVVVGNPDTLRSDPVWRRWLGWVEARGCVMSEAAMRELLTSRADKH